VSFRFVFLADVQLGCYASFSGLDEQQAEVYAAKGMTVAAVPRVEGFDWDADRYRRATREINRIKPAFVVIGGDLIDDLSRQDQIDEFLAITGRIDPEIPVHFVPGNHDVAFDGVAPTPESLAAYREVFGPDTYSFTYRDHVFVALNTPIIDHPEHVPGEWRRQAEFLEDELEQAVRSERPVTLIGHHPLFVERADEPDSYWNLPLVRRMPLLEMIHRAGVELGLAGHWHRNGVAVDDGFVQVTSGPVGYPLGPDPSGYLVVDVGPNEVAHHYHALDGL
jgi:3',5'-cyclic AMP phosphodiesterase CpdA